jgi:hypothetical protein
MEQAQVVAAAVEVEDIQVLQPQVHLAEVMEESIILIKLLMELITLAAAAAVEQVVEQMPTGTVEQEALVW